MEKLQNGCTFSEVWASPKNWKTAKKSDLKKQWYVQCYYFDPRFEKKYPKGKVYRKKINHIGSIEKRKELIILYLKEIPILFKNGYNPITKKNEFKIYSDQELNPDMNIIEAFINAQSKIKVSKDYANEIRIAVNRFNKKVAELKMHEIRICDFKRSELKNILESLNLTDHYFNKFKAYLSCLFNELVEYDCCEHNLTRDIRKRKITKKVRKTLEIEHLKQIANYLKEAQPSFYRYMMIFFYSGARSSELFRIKKSDVNLLNQEYKVTIEKGKQYTETVKVILPEALPYWNEVIREANANDYLFSKGLKPGPDYIDPVQITRRWNYHVKSKLVIKDNRIVKKSELKKGDINYTFITSDFYSLKHLFLDKIDESIQAIENISSKLASHTTPTITNSVYLVNKKKRENKILKELKINFNIN